MILEERVRTWILASQYGELAINPQIGRQGDQITDLRAGILERGISASEFQVTEENLAALSELCAGISRWNGSASELTLIESSATFEFVSRLGWPSDDFGERSEILCLLAFTAWRHSRLLGKTRDSYAWLALYEEEFRKSGVARDCVLYFLGTPETARSDELWDRFLDDPETVLSICCLLREKVDVHTRAVSDGASALHRHLSSGKLICEIPGERGYFLGRAALTAAGTFRQLGQRKPAEDWLAQAEQHFSLETDERERLEIAYQRLCLSYDGGGHQTTLESVDSLAASFGKLGADHEEAKCLILKAAALRLGGRMEEARLLFEELREVPAVKEHAALLSFVLIPLGEIYEMQGDSDRALSTYDEARLAVRRAAQPVNAIALQVVLGEHVRNRGRVQEALSIFQSAFGESEALGLSLVSVRIRVLMAEALLSIGRDREAEDELLRALPTIEKEMMVPEAFATVALLRESLRRRRADPGVLQELRERIWK